MIRLTIYSIASIAVLIVGVVAGAGVYQHRGAHAAAIQPVTIQDADVDGDGMISILDLAAAADYFNQPVPNIGRPVAEQNLDGNGNIKVHEQGTVNVNVVATQPAGTIIPVFVNASSPPSGETLSYVDVSACSHLDLFDEGGGPNGVTVWSSVDGANRFANIFSLNVILTGYGYRNSGRLVFGGDTGVRSPFVGVAVSNGVNEATGVNVSLYCSR